MSPKPTVIVGLSGGVDSAVAAHLLQQQGYPVKGVFLHLWSGKDETDNIVNEKQCCSLEGYEDVRRVAYHLGVPLTILNLSDAFGSQVVQEFIDEYRAGRTPNPCVTCNATIKFGLFWEKTDRLFGSDTLHATGHYARLVRDAEGHAHIERPADAGKDQTYFLSRLQRTQLDRMLFPLGDLLKEEVRRIAAEINLPVAQKKESQGVCFIKHKPADFLRSQLVTGTPGPIRLLETGDIVGEHLGLPFYTRGQRHGLKLGGGTPLYVVDLESSSNTVVVTSDATHPALSASRVQITGTSWLESQPQVGDRFRAQFRYHQAPADVTIEAIDDTTVTVQLDTPMRAVMPGQAAVFYQGDRLWGGGRIASTLPQSVKDRRDVTVATIA